MAFGANIPNVSASPDSQSPCVARLVAISGPLSGEVLPLYGPEIFVGRDPSNTICLADLALSRSHCSLLLDNGVWRIRDRHSFNGTFVNGAQVTDYALKHRDRIELGESVFLFIDEAAKSDVSVEERPSQLLKRLRLDETINWQHESGSRGSRAESDLRALLRIATDINCVRTEDELQEHLLELLADVVPAEHLAIITVGPDGESRIGRTRHVEGSPRAAISDAVVRQALHERVSLLARDAEDSQALRDVASMVWQSILCVPLVVRNRALGALYLTTTKKAAFDDQHLELVTAVANVTAVTLDNVRQVAWLEGEKERLRTALERDQSLVGRSPAMQRIYELVAKVARSAATTVLITGETGTGKELVARAVHLNSDRAGRPFVAINCAALTETLLETELFGHERGAFTGAVAQKKGKLEVADGGTVFLDEVGELPPALQSKLLRAIQQREFERVGGTRPVSVDVRVISATNRNLADEVAAGRFRSDLYHRLNVVQIDVPPLRERREDIPRLATHFVGRFARKARRPVRGISPAAMKHMTAYPWPGNVRELENTIERAIVLGSSDHVLAEDLPEALLEHAGPRTSQLPRYHEWVRDAKVRVIVDAFREARRSYVEAARLLGLHPNYLHRLIRNLDLKTVLEQETVR
jgi:transcriptional regulator with GAF, ATPase, and Fis domain